jgi:hypothetical protein
MTDATEFPVPVTLDVVVINYRDLERLIEQIYGRVVSIPATYEMGNDSYHDVDVTFVAKGDLDIELHNTLMQGWLEDKSQYVDIEGVMCDLVLKGVFPARHYFIEVYW